jgi:hypothetical protein
MYGIFYYTVIFFGVMPEGRDDGGTSSDDDDVYLDRITQQEPKNCPPYVQYR